MHDAGHDHEGAASAAPLPLTGVLGRADAPEFHDLIHAMEHRGQVETVRVSRADAARRRMRLVTDRGRDCALMLPREAKLEDRAVLLLSDDLAIVARVDGGPRLRLTPADAASALRLGYHCGNLHWKADFADGAIEIHMDGPEESYRARLVDAATLADFTVERVEPEE